MRVRVPEKSGVEGDDDNERKAPRPGAHASDVQQRSKHGRDSAGYKQREQEWSNSKGSPAFGKEPGVQDKSDEESWCCTPDHQHQASHV